MILVLQTFLAFSSVTEFCWKLQILVIGCWKMARPLNYSKWDHIEVNFFRPSITLIKKGSLPVLFYNLFGDLFYSWVFNNQIGVHSTAKELFILKFMTAWKIRFIWIFFINQFSHNYFGWNYLFCVSYLSLSIVTIPFWIHCLYSNEAMNETIPGFFQWNTF